MIYKFKNGGVHKLQSTGSVPITRVTMPEIEENYGPQIDGSRVEKKPVDYGQPKHVRTSKEADELAQELLREADLKSRKEAGGRQAIDDKPLEVEHPGLILAFPEWNMYGLAGGAARIGMGLIGSQVGSATLGAVGDNWDNAFETNGFGKAGRTVGGVLGYGLGSLGTSHALHRTFVTPENLDRMGAPQDLVQTAQTYHPTNLSLWADRVEHAIKKPFFYSKFSNEQPLRGGFIGKGAESSVYDNIVNPETVIKVQSKGVVVPSKLSGTNVMGSTIESATDKGQYLAGIKSTGIYNVPQKMTGTMPVDGRYAPVFEQPKMTQLLKRNTPLTKSQSKRLLRTFINSQRHGYTDAHFRNIALYKNTPWLIDNPKRSLLDIPTNFSQNGVNNLVRSTIPPSPNAADNMLAWIRENMFKNVSDQMPK